MFWKAQGPWGSGPRSGGNGDGDGPWGGGSRGGGNGGGGRGPWGNGPRGGGDMPDFDAFLRQGQERIRRMLPGGLGGGRGIALIIAIVLFFWGVSGFYRVQPDEQGVTLLFGRHVGYSEPGLNYWFPAPVGAVLTPKVTQTNQITIGFRGSGSAMRDVPQESLMLTGDQNIMDIDFIVQWRIADAAKFLFNIRDPEVTVKFAAESAMREVVGQTDLEPIMTRDREAVAARARELIQSILDQYEAGINILDVKLIQADPPQEVIDAFNDVQRARQDKERLQNEAQTYRNDIVPKAKGQAQRMIEDATAYKEKLIREAEGQADRFNNFYETYAANKDVTARRMYLETMEEVLGKSEKVIIDDKAESGGVVPYLPLPEITKRNRSAGQGNNGQGGTP